MYEFLLRYVVSSDTDAKVAKKHIDQNFVVHLLDLFDSGACCAALRSAGHAVVVFAAAEHLPLWVRCVPAPAKWNAAVGLHCHASWQCRC